MQLANKLLKLHKSLNTVIKLMTRKITQPNLYKQKKKKKKYNIYALKPRFWVKYPQSMLWAEIRKKKKKKKILKTLFTFLGAVFETLPAHSRKKQQNYSYPQSMF